MIRQRYLIKTFIALILLALPLHIAGCGGSSATRATDMVPAGGRAKVAPAVSASVATSGPATPDGTGTVSVSDAPEPASQSAPEDKTAAANSVPPPQGPVQQTAASRVAASLAQGPGNHRGEVAECWLPLADRLQNDPKVRPESLRFLRSLPEYSPAPMGTKVKELFTSAFLRKKAVDDGKPKPPPSRIYRNVVTSATVQKCATFLIRNKTIFDRVEAKYPVPREILAALLYVETRLGTYVGKDNALWSLACMAAADRPERVQGGMSGIPITGKHEEWLQARLSDKSQWAYNELRALLAFCDVQNLDPMHIPGSVYGAIGICQFMPSNLLPYGEDGDGDGVINLFSEADAIFSAAKYLTKHGWSKGMSVERQRAVLKRYNNLNVYANTILALGESVRTGVLQTGPPDARNGAVKASAAKK